MMENKHLKKFQTLWKYILSSLNIQNKLKDKQLIVEAMDYDKIQSQDCNKREQLVHKVL